MRNTIFLVLILILGQSIYAQSAYVDPAVTGAVALYGVQIKAEQEDANKKLNRLQEAQLVVAGQLAYVNDIQNKVYKGMSEVNDAIKDGLTLKRVYSNITNTIEATGELAKIAGKHPEFLVFTTRHAKAVKDKAVEIGTDVSGIVASGGKNLMTSGDRRILISKLENDTFMLYILTIAMKNALNRAINVGFWRGINPFQDYINTDKDLFQNTMRNAGILLN